MLAGSAAAAGRGFGRKLSDWGGSRGFDGNRGFGDNRGFDGNRGFDDRRGFDGGFGDRGGFGWGRKLTGAERAWTCKDGKVVGEFLVLSYV